MKLFPSQHFPECDYKVNGIPHVQLSTDRQMARDRRTDRQTDSRTDRDCHAQIETFQVTLEKV